VRARAERALLAPPEDVWAFVAEPHNLPDWWPGVDAVRPDRRGTATGARWLAYTADPGWTERPQAESTLLLLDVDPGRRLAFRHVERRLDAELELADLPGRRTRATLEVRARVVWGPTRSLPGQALGRLHDLVQTSAGAL
jgi:uncharacterized protein YndB with AHSA1/START domain